jgi:transmembrane sensor
MSDKRLADYFEPVGDDAMARVWAKTNTRLEKADRWRRPLRALSFGVVVVAAVCVAFFIARSVGPKPGADTQIVELADGSLVEHTAQDHVEIDVVTPERVELTLQKGRAMFRVAKNPNRKFVTHAGGHIITVLGTVYTVDVSVDSLAVTVTEGVVEVAREDGTGRWRLHAGEHWSGAARPAASVASNVEPPSPTPAETAAPSAPPEPAPAIAPSPNATVARPSAGGSTAASTDGNPAAAALFQRAQDARLAGHTQEAARLLNEFLRKYPNDPRAGIAAFELGRLRLDSDDPKGALDALNQAADNGAAFEEQVAARRVQALEQSGDMVACQAAKKAFLKRFPQGSFAAVVAQRCRSKTSP